MGWMRDVWEEFCDVVATPPMVCPRCLGETTNVYTPVWKATIDLPGPCNECVALSAVLQRT